MATTPTRGSRSNLTLREATLEDIPELLKDIRPADLAEIRAMTTDGPLRRLARAIAASRRTWAALRNDTGKVVTLVGVCAGPDGEGIPWAHCTNAIEQFPVEFTRKGMLITKQMHEMFPVLSNYVDERNTVHINWLRWMGYEMLNRTTALSIDGTVGFIHFRRVAQRV